MEATTPQLDQMERRPQGTASSSRPRAAVAICARNEEATLEDAVRSVLQQDLSAGGYEILIIDNGSTDSTRAAAERLAAEHPQRVRVLREPEAGLSRARNLALRAADAEMIAFMDADALAGPEWLRSLLEVFDAHPEAGAAGGPVRVHWDHPRPRWWDDRLDEVFNAAPSPDIDGALAYPRYPYGTNFAVRRSAALAVGGFRHDLGRDGRSLRAGEEGELCLRLEQAGWTVRHAARASVEHRTHPARLSRRYILRRALAHGASQAVIERAHELRSPEYLDGPQLVRLAVSRIISGQLDLPTMKYLLFRLGYQLERRRDRPGRGRFRVASSVKSASPEAAAS